MVRSDALRRALGAAFMLALLAPSGAAAHVRHTTPVASATSGTCSAAMPCRIDHAVNGAAHGDEVVVASGIYQVGTLLAPDAIDLHGEDGKAPPLLIGAPSLPDNMLAFKAGGTLRHLSLRSTSPSEGALTLYGSLAEDLTVVSEHAGAAKAETGLEPTVLRDSVLITEAAGTGPAALRLLENDPAGSIELRNITALAPSAQAIHCEVAVPGQATMVNLIARGGAADIDSSTSGSGCSATHSSLRAEKSPGTSLGSGVQSADPLLDADHRPLPESPTVDAGIADGLTSAEDPDGRARTTPDIGAFECCGDPAWPPYEVPGTEPTPDPAPAPTATATPTVTPQPPAHGIPAPVLGETILVAPGRGKVLVRRPGAKRFRKLGAAALLPSGTVVDARRGRIRLTSALDEEGTTQTGRFWGARFRIRQGHRAQGMTSLTLRGGDFGDCPARASALARASGVARDPARRVVRRLWARDRGGRFRTYGNNSVATARGTAWVTRDRCDGTETRVHEGAVAVKDKRTGKTVLVRAGDSYLARR